MPFWLKGMSHLNISLPWVPAGTRAGVAVDHVMALTIMAGVGGTFIDVLFALRTLKT